MEELSRYELLKSKLRCDCPYLQNCCCCVPLRRGLLIFGYFKLISACLLIGLAFMPIAWLLIFAWMDGIFHLVFFLLAIVSITVLISDLAFSILAVVSAHKKNWKTMKACYYYTIIYLVMVTVLFTIFLIFFADVSYSDDLLMDEIVISTVVVYLLDFGLHCYLALLMRSAVYKFENDFNFRYVRNVDEEPTCVMET